MPDQDKVRIEWKGKVGRVPKDRVDEFLANGAKLLDAPGPSVWQALNTPVGSERGSRIPAGGIPQITREKIANFVGKTNLSDENKRRLAYALDIPAEFFTSVPEAGRQLTTPLSVSTLGAGTLLQRLRQLKNVPDVVKALVAAAETGGATYFGAQGIEQGLTPRKENEPVEDYLGRVMSGAGQAIFGGVGVTHGIGPTVETATKKGVRSFSGAGEGTVQSAEAEARVKEADIRRERSAKEREQAEKQTLAKVKARSEAEAGNIERDAERAKLQADHQVAVETAKLKHQAELDAYGKAIEGNVTRQAHAQLRNERLEKAQKVMADSRDQTAKDMTENFNKAEAAERQQLDSRYEDFRRRVLGVDEQHPNGTLQSELSPIGDAVQYARKNLLKGSRTSIVIFNDITGRLKDFVETPEGELKPTEGQMIFTDQLRGYDREFGDALYTRDIPSDVADALKYVQDKIKGEVHDTIKDSFGQPAAEAYKRLNKDWSDYKRMWFDTSSVSPIPKIRRMLRDPLTMNEGIQVWERVAKMIKGETGRGVVKLMATKRAFGADPNLPARLMALDKKLGSLSDLYQKVPVAKYPRVPKLNEPKAPELPEEPTSSKYALPSALEPFKEPESFNRERFIKERVGSRMNLTGRFGEGLAAVSILSDLVRGNPTTALTVAERIALAEALRTVLTSPRFLNWVSSPGSSIERAFGGGP